MKRFFAVSLVVALLVIFLVPVSAGRKIQVTKRPKLALLPVQVEVEDGNTDISQAVKASTYDAFASMKFQIVSGQSVVKAAGRRGIGLYQGSGGSKLGMPASSAVVDDENLLRIGRSLGADYAAGVRYQIWPKTTRHLNGARQNGKCVIEVKIIDIRRAEVLYEYPIPGLEGKVFGAAKTNDWKSWSTGAGVLMAGGMLGKGRTVRNIGWAGIVAPHAIRGGGKIRVQYEAALLAMHQVLGDFHSRFTAGDL